MKSGPKILLLAALTLVLLCVGGCRKRGPAPDSQPPPPLPSRLVHVLCYHNVVSKAANLYDTSAADFEAQLRTLQAGGYQSISCEQLADYLANVKDLPDKSVLITFDDGRESVIKAARPLLDKYGFKATLFLITGSVGAKGSLTWDEVKTLAAAGYEVGSHTAGHLNLTRVPKGHTLASHQGKVRGEIERSFTDLSERLGKPPVALAYPYGNYDAFAMDAARSAGFRLGLSIDPGAVDEHSDPYMLPRKMIVNGTSLKTFERFLAVEPLHLTSLSPPLGERVKSRSYSLTARVSDPDALDHIGAEAGKQTRVKLNPDTSELTVTSTLNRGANLVRVFSSGQPRRETGWIVVCDP